MSSPTLPQHVPHAGYRFPSLCRVSPQGVTRYERPWAEGEAALTSALSVILISISHFAEPPFSFQADKKDSQGNNTVSGFEILLQKQLKGKQMQKEMAEFVRER